MDPCPYCLEKFGASTPNVPRVLPCGHSLCDVCVKVVIKAAKNPLIHNGI